MKMRQHMFKSPAALGRKLSDIGVPSQALESLPDAMQRAVRLMLAGAGATAVWGVFFIVAAAANNSGTASGRELATGTAILLFEVIIYVALWVLMARKAQSGRNWARIASSVLWLLWSYQTYGSLRGISSVVLAVNMILILAIWMIGFGALFLLWRPDSTAFFRAR